MKKLPCVTEAVQIAGARESDDVPFASSIAARMTPRRVTDDIKGVSILQTPRRT
jgi:hypothetical protein